MYLENPSRILTTRIGTYIMRYAAATASAPAPIACCSAELAVVDGVGTCVLDVAVASMVVEPVNPAALNAAIAEDNSSWFISGINVAEVASVVTPASVLIVVSAATSPSKQAKMNLVFMFVETRC